MKQVSLYFLFAFGLSGFCQSPTTAPFSANYISVNQSGEIWAFGEGSKYGSGLYYDFNGWNYVQYDLSKGIIAASSKYGEILIVNNKGEVSEWNSNNKRWIAYAGISGAKDAFISKKDANNKYVLGTVSGADGIPKYGLWKVSNISLKASDWHAVEVSDPLVKQFIKASNDKVGNFYYVSNDGKIYAKYSGAKVFTPLNMGPKFAEDVLVGDDGELYMMERGGGIYKWNKSASNWTSSKLSGSSFGVDDKGNVYAVVNNEIHAIKNGNWQKISLENPNKLDQNGNTPITSAVQLKDQNALQKAISAGTDVDAANSEGDYPIIIAAKNGDQNSVNVLIQNKAEIDIRDKADNTALHYAVLMGNQNVAQALLIGKADPNAQDYVTNAVSMKNEQMIILLASYKANLNPGLVKAAELNDVDLFRTLIGLGAKLEGNSAYELAVDRNNIEIIQLALDNGAEKNNAINYAVLKSNKEVIIMCLQSGADTSPAVAYVLQNNDVQLAQDLVEQFGVSANTLMDYALPGAKTSSTSQEGTNIEIAGVALQNGAKADNYFDYAVKSKNTVLVELLLMHGGDSNKLLQAAVENNDIENAAFAFDNGADPAKNTNLFLSAIENNQSDIAILFLERGAPVTDSRLIKAAVNQSNVGITKLLLENGAPVTDNSLMTTAVGNNQEVIVQDLLTFGADPNAAILPAIEKNATKMTIMMLEAGAEARTPILIDKAAGLGNEEIATALLMRGAQPDDGVISSIKGGHEGMFNLLMDNGADNNNINFLVVTVQYDRTSMFKRLIANGAPVAYKGSNQENLLHISCRNGNFEITEILLQQGVDVNQKNVDGSTPLHIAANSGRNNVEMCSLLVNNGADVNAVDNKGKSVLKVADGKKLKDYLKSKGAEK